MQKKRNNDNLNVYIYNMRNENEQVKGIDL